MIQRRRKGYIVQCQDGRIGRTYHDEPTVDRKVRVYLYPQAVMLAKDADKITPAQKNALLAKAKLEATRLENRDKEPEKRICNIENLKIIGFVD